MTTNPQLPNHLIRELTNIIRCHGNGDAMVRLALSGKEPLSVFEYIVNTRVHLRLDAVYSIMNLEAFDFIKPPRSPFEDFLKVSTKGAQRLFSRFVRNLDMDMSVGLRMPIDWANLTDLTLCEVSDSFFAGVVNGTISMSNLRMLTIALTLAQFLKLLSTTSCFSLPEEVIFNIQVRDGDLTDHSSFQTFPKVRHCYFCCEYKTAITVELLYQFSTVIKGLPNLETASISLLHEHDFHPLSFEGIVTAKEQLRNLSFSVPVTISYNERVVYNHRQTPTHLYDRLDSIGFEQLVDLLTFSFRLESDNVKLGYHLHFMSDNDYYHQ